MTIRERVIELAKSQDMKQSELADAIKAPRSTVNGWFKSDKRNPSAEYILPICKLFNVDVESVNTQITAKKPKKRQGRTAGYTTSVKKAIVVLKKDSKPIAFFESLS